MTESVSSTLSSPKRVEVSSEKLQKPLSLSCSFRESSEPELKGLGLGCKSRKRKAPPPQNKGIGGCKRLKQTEKSRSLSLESALNGKLLSGDQLKKKELLEILVSVNDGERMTLSKYLHECGFSYESQSVMVSVKSVKKNMINYLVSMFFSESENPLTDNSLDKGVLRRMSNRWGVIQDIVKDTEPKITAEEATLSLLKNEGLAYESMIIFLDLFERSVHSNSQDCEGKVEDQKYKKLRYPFSEAQLIRDVLEIAKGNYVSLKEFIEIFRVPSSKKVSEWEKMKASVWERGAEESNLSEEQLLDHVRKCLKVKGGSRNKHALMDCLMISDFELDGKKGTLLNFLRSDYGANLSTVDAMSLLVKCIGTASGSKNKQAFVSCLTQPEIELNGESVSLYMFLKLEAGLSASDAIHLLAKCFCWPGASKNKQAFVECLSQPEINLGGEKAPLYTFLKLEAGLSSSDAIHLLAKCIGSHGGSKNKQAFVECLSQAEIDLDGKKVPLYVFLTSKKGCGLSPFEAIGIIVKFVANGGGSKNKQAFMECISRAEPNLEGKTVYAFLNLKCGLSATKTIDSIVKCIGTGGGCKNKQAFLECISQAERDLENETVYSFLKSKCGFSATEAIDSIVKCIGTDGGCKNKQAFIECLSKPEINLDGENVSLYTFLVSKQMGGLSRYVAIETIVKCIGFSGGSQNKKVLIDIFCELEVNLDGRRVSLLKFLISKQGGGMSCSEATQVVVKVVGNCGGSKNKQAFLACLSKPDIKMNGKLVSLYTFLSSKEGVGFNASAAIQIITRCVGCRGGRKNMQMLKACFNQKLADMGCKKSLYELFLSGKLTPKEAISMCLMFSINRYALNTKAVFCLFDSKEKDKPANSVIGLLNSLSISGYTMLFNLVSKVLKYPNMTTDSKRRFFTLSCQSLARMFLDKDGYFYQKKQGNLGWSVADLARRCINAYALYAGNDINHELKERERLVVDWIRSFRDEYQLTKQSLAVITSVQSLDDLKLLIELSNREIAKGRKKNVNDAYCEHCLIVGLQILIKCKRSTIQAILKYESVLLNWFDLKRLCGLLTTILRHIKTDKSIGSFFKNRKEMEQLLPSINLKKIQKTDWILLIRLIQKWDLEKDNVTQEELSFLIRIGYQLPKGIVIAWPNFSGLENTEKGCCVLNRTRYPNWVFALSYFQQVYTYLSEKCCIIKHKDRILFGSTNDSVPKKYSFPLFKIESHKKGFIFVGESVESVACFYARSGLDKWISILETKVSKTTGIQKVNPSSNELEDVMAIEFQKKSDDSKEEIDSGKETRKRKGANIETKWEEPKKIKLFSRQEITHLYETVSRRERLTEKDCESFMQGACYLSETMLDVLTKKTLVEEIRNKEVQEKWQAFVDRYEKEKMEKIFEMIRDFDLLKGLAGVFPEDEERKADPMFSQLEEDFMFLIPEQVEDKDIDFFPSIPFDSLFDCLEEVCSYEV